MQITPSSLDRMAKGFTTLFPLWVLLFAGAAWYLPAPFAALQPLMVPGLGLIMFGMGMTLRASDFVRVLSRPRAVFCGLLAQFLIMPFAALLISRACGLSPELTMGMIIVGSCPGGTASNVISYLARADVALSVTMTACSTVLAVFLTPGLVWLLGDTVLAVDPAGLFLSVVKVVLLPVTGGLLVHALLGTRLERWLPLFPPLSVMIIVLVIATIVALARDQIAQVFGIVALAVVLHNLGGLALGYGMAALFRLPVSARRTVAIEVAMQNSGLGVALATSHFTSHLVAVPSTFFSVVHNLTGSVIAGFWSRRAPLD